MKNYRITVNGTAYDVAVEELGQGAVAPVQTPVAPATPVPVAPAAPAPTISASGSIKVNAPMPGKILSIKATVGQAVKKGDVILILEAMKMENEIVAPEDGTIASITAKESQSVEAGAELASLS